MVLSTTEVRGQVRRFVKQLDQHVHVERAILFGSYAYGHPHVDSDIDLAIISSDFGEMGRLKRLELLEEVAWAVQVHKIEAVGFTPQELQDAGEANLVSEIRDRGVLVPLTTEPEPLAIHEKQPAYPSEESEDE